MNDLNHTALGQVADIIYNQIAKVINEARFDITTEAVIKERVEGDKYKIAINGGEYIVYDTEQYEINSSVNVMIPQNDYSRMYILNRATPVETIVTGVSTVNGRSGTVVIALDDIPNLRNLLNAKVNVVNGKVLTSNDFTNTYKNKLDNIDADANNYEHPSFHESAIIRENDNKQFISKAQKEDLEKAKHTHANKALIDNVSQDIINGWNDKYSKVEANKTTEEIMNSIIKTNRKRFIPSDKQTTFILDDITIPIGYSIEISNPTFCVNGVLYKENEDYTLAFRQQDNKYIVTFNWKYTDNTDGFTIMSCHGVDASIDYKFTV